MSPQSLPTLALLAVGTAFHASGASAAWHDDFAGAGVPVHYVRLSGHGGDNDANRRNLVAMHRSCIETNTAMGRPAKPLPGAGAPPVVSVHEIEIYYAGHRTLTVSHGTLYSIEMADCALFAVPSRTLEWAWRGGNCKADLIRKRARNSCDAAAWAASEAAPLAPARPTGATDETRVVAGLRCQVHRPLPGMELCVAQPAAPHTLNPDPILSAPLNAGAPGLLLEARSPALTLQALEVRTNLSVSRELFALPPGLNANAGPTR